MCTLTWVCGANGYELLFNRDERLTRGTEIAAREGRVDGVRHVAPRDSEAGGTWITTNEYGVSVCLLNGYAASRGKRAGERSRGLLVLGLASASTVTEVERRLAEHDLAPYDTFTLCAFDPGGARSFDWNGRRSTTTSLASRDAPICSSGYDAPGVRQQRTALLARIRAGRPLDVDILREFHTSHADRPSAYSPCMHRSDAATRSLSQVLVAAGLVTLTYTPGPPCSTPPGQPIAIERRDAHATQS